MRVWKVCEFSGIDDALCKAIEECRRITDALWVVWAKKGSDTMVLCLGMLLTQSGRQPDWVGTSMPREYTRHSKKGMVPRMLARKLPVENDHSSDEGKNDLECFVGKGSSCS